MVVKRKHVATVSIDGVLTVSELRKLLRGVSGKYRVRIPSREAGGIFDIADGVRVLSNHVKLYPKGTLTLRELRKQLQGVPGDLPVRVPKRKPGCSYVSVGRLKTMDDYKSVYVGK